MSSGEFVDVEVSLFRTSKICKVISLAMKFVLAVLFLWWIVTTIFMTVSILSPELFVNDNPVSPGEVVLYIFSGVAAIAVFIILINIFSESAKGHTPFTMIQVRRLRCLAAVLALYAVFEISFNLVALDFMTLEGESSVVTVNLFSVVSAAVLYAFSFVFKYGVLLQEFSDETL